MDQSSFFEAFEIYLNDKYGFGKYDYHLEFSGVGRSRDDEGNTYYEECKVTVIRAFNIYYYFGKATNQGIEICSSRI